MSAITYMEVVRGIQDKEKLRKWKIFINNFGIKILMVDPEISSKAMFLCDEYTLSHGLFVSDALIVATAIIHEIPLVTGNVKDFQFIPNVTIKRFSSVRIFFYTYLTV